MTKKRTNRADLTLRNLRATKKRIEIHVDWMLALELMLNNLAKRVSRLEKKPTRRRK